MPIVCQNKGAFEINNPGDISVKSIACLRKLRGNKFSSKVHYANIIEREDAPAREVLLKSSVKKTRWRGRKKRRGMKYIKVRTAQV